MEHFNLRIPSNKKYVKFSRHVLKKFFETISYEEDSEIFLIELALNEAIANIIEHTYKFEENHNIDIEVIYTEKSEEKYLEIKLRDYGEKVIVENVKPRDLEDYKDGGLGVYIINQVFKTPQWIDVEEGNLMILKKQL